MGRDGIVKPSQAMDKRRRLQVKRNGGLYGKTVCISPLLSKLAGDRASGQANSLILLSWRRQRETGCRLPTDAVQIVAHGSSRIVPRQIGPEWRFCDGFRGL